MIPLPRSVCFFGERASFITLDLIPLPSFLFSPLLLHKFLFFPLFQPELATVAFSPLASPFSTPLLVSFSLPLLREESIKQRYAFIPREDRLTIIEKKLFSPRRGKSIDCDHACRKKRERGERRRRRREVRKNDEMYSGIYGRVALYLDAWFFRGGVINRGITCCGLIYF